MTPPLPALAYDRQDVMVAALLGLAVAAVVVSLGAWVLLWRERRRRRGLPDRSPGRPGPGRA